MPFYKENIANKVSFFIVIVLIYIDMMTSDAMISEESDFDSRTVEANNKINNLSDFNNTNHFDSSTSLSEERPIEDYINGKDLLIARNPYYGDWWKSCYKKTELFCNKQCRRALDGVCREYRCIQRVFRAIKVGCALRCKSNYGTLIMVDKNPDGSIKLVPSTKRKPHYTLHTGPTPSGFWLKPTYLKMF